MRSGPRLATFARGLAITWLAGAAAAGETVIEVGPGRIFTAEDLAAGVYEGRAFAPGPDLRIRVLDGGQLGAVPRSEPHALFDLDGGSLELMAGAVVASAVDDRTRVGHGRITIWPGVVSGAGATYSGEVVVHGGAFGFDTGFFGTVLVNGGTFGDPDQRPEDDADHVAWFAGEDVVIRGGRCHGGVGLGSDNGGIAIESDEFVAEGRVVLYFDGPERPAPIRVSGGYFLRGIEHLEPLAISGGHFTTVYSWGGLEITGGEVTGGLHVYGGDVAVSGGAISGGLRVHFGATFGFAVRSALIDDAPLRADVGETLRVTERDERRLRLVLEDGSPLEFTLTEGYPYAAESWGLNADWVDILLTFVGEPCNVADVALPYGRLEIGDVVRFLTWFGDARDGADLASPLDVFDVADIAGFLKAFGHGCR